MIANNTRTESIHNGRQAAVCLPWRRTEKASNYIYPVMHGNVPAAGRVWEKDGGEVDNNMAWNLYHTAFAVRFCAERLLPNAGGKPQYGGTELEWDDLAKEGCSAVDADGVCGGLRTLT